MNDEVSVAGSGGGLSALKGWGEVLGEFCRRPGMFTASADLSGVLDFVGGYLYAQGLLCPEPEPEWRQFNYWLARRFGYPRNSGWYQARRYFPSDEEALAAFPGRWPNSGAKGIVLPTPQHNNGMHPPADTAALIYLQSCGAGG